jgi:phosphatidylserine decarboxylase
LFSVNRTTARLVPGLFSRNERVFCGFDSGGMPWGIVLVGALNVGSMATVWHGDVTPRKHREVTALPVTGQLAPIGLPKGAMN